VREAFAETWGTVFAYGALTQTRVLALRREPKERDDLYSLLFSFSSVENKAEFLRLFQSNDLLAFDDDDDLHEALQIIPDPSEIAAARPIAMVLPSDCIRSVTEVALVVLGMHGRVELKVARPSGPLCSKCCTFAVFKW
jgi:hypothetical protein